MVQIQIIIINDSSSHKIESNISSPSRDSTYLHDNYSINCSNITTSPNSKYDYFNLPTTNVSSNGDDDNVSGDDDGGNNSNDNGKNDSTMRGSRDNIPVNKNYSNTK